MPVVRVRSTGDSAPLTEFDIPVGLLARRPDCYVVVDDEPRRVPRGATFKEGSAVPAKGKSNKKIAASAAESVGVTDVE